MHGIYIAFFFFFFFFFFFQFKSPNLDFNLLQTPFTKRNCNNASLF